MKTIPSLLLLLLASFAVAQTPGTPVAPGNAVTVDPTPAERVPGVTPPPNDLNPNSVAERIVQDRKGDFGLMLMQGNVNQRRVCCFVAILIGVVLFIFGLVALLADPGGIDAGWLWGMIIFGIIIIVIAIWFLCGAVNGAALSILSNSDIPMR